MNEADASARQTIAEVIERETTAFLMRDFEAWQACWLQDDSVRRLGALMGGLMDWQEGWESGLASIERIMRNYPEPNAAAAKAMRRTNYSFRVGADMAWVSYDQYGPISEDPLVTVGLSHQIRVLEKHAEQWKIAMAGHGDTSLEYFTFPVLRIDETARIIWMNDAARSELLNHPAIMKSGAHLRARDCKDDRRLRAAILEASGETVMERRPSLLKPDQKPEHPVVLSGRDDDGPHILWVSQRDGMLLVSFEDAGPGLRRLEEAKDLYGLSRGQVRLAECLLSGLDIPAAADRLGVKPSTARTHLQRLFEKTGARSQTALVAVLLGAAPPD